MDAVDVAAVFLLDRGQHVVHRLADVVPEGHAVLEDVGHEVGRAEALTQRQRSAHVERRVEAQEDGVGVEERHVGVAGVVLAETEVARHRHADGEELEVVVVDALGQARGAGGVDHHVRRHRIHFDVGRVERSLGRADLRGQRRGEVRRVV